MLLIRCWLNPFTVEPPLTTDHWISLNLIVINCSSAATNGGVGPSGTDSQPEAKGFYENLPFHGLQPTPNKVSSLTDLNWLLISWLRAFWSILRKIHNFIQLGPAKTEMIAKFAESAIH